MTSLKILSGFLVFLSITLAASAWSDSQGLDPALARTTIADFGFTEASVRDIGKTLAQLFNRKFVMSPEDDVRVNIPTKSSETIEAAWARFLATIRDQGLDAELTKRTLRIYRKKGLNMPFAQSSSSRTELPTKVVPNLTDGKFTGYAIFQIKSGSIYDKLGFKNGDIITEVDGKSAIDFSPDLLADVLGAKAPLVTKHSIQFLRNRKKQITTYEMK